MSASVSIKVTLPPIDQDTKQRIIAYFTAAKKIGRVRLETIRDGLPEEIKMAKFLVVEPASGRMEDTVINHERITVTVSYPKKPPENNPGISLGVRIDTQINMNSAGISCGMRTEILSFSEDYPDWYLSLKSDSNVPAPRKDLG